jgi:4-diphosphocytidyl-2-C-methyl-D-erythritol kinase
MGVELLVTRAPAKINLTLCVLGRLANGYHALESLVAFTGAGDTLSLAPGGQLALDISGPTASAAGAGLNNLVLRAAAHLADSIPGLRLGAFHLIKRLPVAAGVGGGSSDAAAALRLLARANDIPLDDPRIMAAARATGSDVPVCLSPRGRMMGGAGEQLGERLDLPAVPAVLVNPGVPVETRPVFERLGLSAGERTQLPPHPPAAKGMSRDELWTVLEKGRNDLEDPACLVAPIIPGVLAVLGAARGAKLARMSGSGATCFALFSTRSAASAAAAAIRAHNPNWWVKATLLR